VLAVCSTLPVAEEVVVLSDLGYQPSLSLPTRLMKALEYVVYGARRLRLPNHLLGPFRRLGTDQRRMLASILSVVLLILLSNFPAFLQLSERIPNSLPSVSWATWLRVEEADWQDAASVMTLWTPDADGYETGQRKKAISRKQFRQVAVRIYQSSRRSHFPNWAP